MITLILMLKKIEREDKNKYDTFNAHSKAETIINERDIDGLFKSIYTAVLSNKQKFLGKGSGSIIDLLTEHNINISKYNPLDGSSCIKLPKELDHPRKGLISIQNINDNECFKRSIVRYSNPADRNPTRIAKAGKYFATKLGFKDKKFPVKIRDIHKIEKKNSIGISVFGYENKEKHPVYVSKKCCEEKHVDILLIESEGKRHYVLITDFDTFMYDHTLHRGRKHFCRY